MGIILYIVSVILGWILTPLFHTYAIIRLMNFNKIQKYFHDVAFGIDQMGNVSGSVIMNDVLLKKNPAKLYGNPDETISHVTGVNYISNTLTIFGKALAWILNFVDNNHVQNAANNNQDNTK